MSFNLNKVMVAGNLTRDPEIRFLDSGPKKIAVCNFGIAINRKYKKDDKLCEEVTFLDCEAWGRTAELIGQYCTKGKPVFVEGRLKLDTWEDKDGAKRSKIKVVADNVQFLGSKPKEEGEADTPTVAKAKEREKIQAAVVDDSEPPF